MCPRGTTLIHQRLASLISASTERLLDTRALLTGFHPSTA
ncbi:hypothetical protein NBRC111894_3955 [Sporolactobacillus inulinus]|uniref:Uncharacterized protein n=1 Tax=Sporolactobacillus inulinus TaxID=2078 RepID=A0A4Y1ZHG6_9BACL|nr:hypothetical protein NBRC111894_3955 [Sporolactobacillus inulinus]